MTTSIRRSRLRSADVVRVAATGIRIRPMRTGLSGLGIAVGIAALIAVLGISASSQANLLAQLAAESNLLTVGSGQNFAGQAAPLPQMAEGMIRQIPPVQEVAAVGAVPTATVRRTAAIPSIDTGGISVMATDLNLLHTLGGRVLHGQFLNPATARYPAVVLGYGSARTLGIRDARPGTQVYLGGRYFAVVGILAPMPIAAEIDNAALVGFAEANQELGLEGHPTRIYLRVDPDQVAAIARVLPYTTNPAQPEAVQISHPSDVLIARSQAQNAFTGLFLGLGAVAVVVGTIGNANVMVISVLERRQEIGLRRSLGARKRHILAQFLAESILVTILGAIIGIVVGALATGVYAVFSHQSVVVPLQAVAGGLAIGLIAGALAGLYPAVRASRLVPTEALRLV